MKFEGKRYRAYTLVEILVVMSIVASLTGLGLFGIRQLNRTNRDDNRKVKLIEMKDAVETYYKVRGRYPGAGSDFRIISPTTIRIGSRDVELSGSSEAVVLVATSTKTTANSTIYRYRVYPDGYMLCSQLENGVWYNIGTSSTICQ